MARTVGSPTLRCCAAIAAVVALAGGSRGAAQPDSSETPPAVTAASLLTPAQLKGPSHQATGVTTEGFFHTVTLKASSGTFEAVGLSQVPVVIKEIEAIASLQDVSKTKVFLEAAGNSVVGVGEGVVSAVKDPGATAKNLGSGIKRFGVNLGRRSERAVESATDKSDDEESKEKEENAAESGAKAILGVNSAMRQWARKVGVDPYTTNQVLRDTLEGIAKVDAAGGIATKVVLPIPQVVGMTSSVGDIVWGKDPEAVRKLNEQGLREMKTPEDVASLFFRNKAYTLTMQTRLVAALRGVNAEGRDDYVKTAAGARRWREALFYVESTEMLARYHQRRPVRRVLGDSRALVTSDSGGAGVALLPLDWLGDTRETRAALQDIGARTRQELKATRLTMVLTGRASPRMTKLLSTSGWTVSRPPAS